MHINKSRTEFQMLLNKSCPANIQPAVLFWTVYTPEEAAAFRPAGRSGSVRSGHGCPVPLGLASGPDHLHALHQRHMEPIGQILCGTSKDTTFGALDVYREDQHGPFLCKHDMNQE